MPHCENRLSRTLPALAAFMNTDLFGSQKAPASGIAMNDNSPEGLLMSGSFIGSLSANASNPSEQYLLKKLYEKNIFSLGDFTFMILLSNAPTLISDLDVFETNKKTFALRKTAHFVPEATQSPEYSHSNVQSRASFVATGSATRYSEGVLTTTEALTTEEGIRDLVNQINLAQFMFMVKLEEILLANLAAAKWRNFAERKALRQLTNTYTFNEAYNRRATLTGILQKNTESFRSEIAKQGETIRNGGARDSLTRLLMSPHAAQVVHPNPHTQMPDGHTNPQMLTADNTFRALSSRQQPLQQIGGYKIIPVLRRNLFIGIAQDTTGHDSLTGRFEGGSYYFLANTPKDRASGDPKHTVPEIGKYNSRIDGIDAISMQAVVMHAMNFDSDGKPRIDSTPPGTFDEGGNNDGFNESTMPRALQIFNYGDPADPKATTIIGEMDMRLTLTDIRGGAASLMHYCVGGNSMRMQALEALETVMLLRDARENYSVEQLAEVLRREFREGSQRELALALPESFLDIQSLSAEDVQQRYGQAGLALYSHRLGIQAIALQLAKLFKAGDVDNSIRDSAFGRINLDTGLREDAVQEDVPVLLLFRALFGAANDDNLRQALLKVYEDGGIGVEDVGQPLFGASLAMPRAKITIEPAQRSFHSLGGVEYRTPHTLGGKSVVPASAVASRFLNDAVFGALMHTAANLTEQRSLAFGRQLSDMVRAAALQKQTPAQFAQSVAAMALSAGYQGVDSDGNHKEMGQMHPSMAQLLDGSASSSSDDFSLPDEYWAAADHMVGAYNDASVAAQARARDAQKLLPAHLYEPGKSVAEAFGATAADFHDFDAALEMSAKSPATRSMEISGGTIKNSRHFKDFVKMPHARRLAQLAAQRPVGVRAPTSSRSFGAGELQPHDDFAPAAPAALAAPAASNLLPSKSSNFDFHWNNTQNFNSASLRMFARAYLLLPVTRGTLILLCRNRVALPCAGLVWELWAAHVCEAVYLSNLRHYCVAVVSNMHAEATKNGRDHVSAQLRMNLGIVPLNPGAVYAFENALLGGNLSGRTNDWIQSIDDMDKVHSADNQLNERQDLNIKSLIGWLVGAGEQLGPALCVLGSSEKDPNKDYYQFEGDKQLHYSGAHVLAKALRIKEFLESRRSYAINEMKEHPGTMLPLGNAVALRGQAWTRDEVGRWISLDVNAGYFPKIACMAGAEARLQRMSPLHD